MLVWKGVLDVDWGDSYMALVQADDDAGLLSTFFRHREYDSEESRLQKEGGGQWVEEMRWCVAAMRLVAGGIFAKADLGFRCRTILSVLGRMCQSLGVGRVSRVDLCWKVLAATAIGSISTLTFKVFGSAHRELIYHS
jgi:hypothetical protein